jgi:hypothetical protein
LVICWNGMPSKSKQDDDDDVEEQDDNVEEQDSGIIHDGADADRVVETEKEATDALRYSYHCLMETDKGYIEKELEDERKDPSTTYRDLGREYIQRA